MKTSISDLSGSSYFVTSAAVDSDELGVSIAYIVDDRPNGASHDRHNGATLVADFGEFGRQYISFPLPPVPR